MSFTRNGASRRVIVKVLCNFAHSYPARLGGRALVAANCFWQAVALMWLAHNGVDRALRYGLKYDAEFQGDPPRNALGG